MKAEWENMICGHSSGDDFLLRAQTGSSSTSEQPARRGWTVRTDGTIMRINENQ